MGFISADRCQSSILFFITILKPNAQYRLIEFPQVTKKTQNPTKQNKQKKLFQPENKMLAK